jgi:maltose O-acetyltransferase
MSKLKRLLRYDLPLHFVLLLTNWLPDNVVFMNFRGWLASFFFNKCGSNLCLGRNVSFYNPSQITIGNNVYIAMGCWMMASNGIAIEDNVLFGPYVTVVTANHSLKNEAYAFGEDGKKSFIRIQSGSWIGAHVAILPGADVNKGVLIAANSVLNSETIAYGIYGGLPGKLIKIEKSM